MVDLLMVLNILCINLARIRSFLFNVLLRRTDYVCMLDPFHQLDFSSSSPFFFTCTLSIVLCHLNIPLHNIFLLSPLNNPMKTLTPVDLYCMIQLIE